MTQFETSIVTAVTQERGLAPRGNGRAEWFMPEDLQRFRRITNGHAVIVAAVTFDTIMESIGHPLDGRTNIVVGATAALPDSCVSVDTLQSGLDYAGTLGDDEVFIMGNAPFYKMAYPDITKLYLTIVRDQAATGEEFPDYRDDFELRSSESGHSGEFDYDFQILTRKKAL